MSVSPRPWSPTVRRLLSWVRWLFFGSRHCFCTLCGCPVEDSQGGDPVCLDCQGDWQRMHEW
jgi:hypothetical protein